MQLKVPGGQKASPIFGAEVYTKEDTILYGSVRTMMQVSTVAGTVSSPFFYYNDNQEADIEVLTADTNNKGLHYTNQKLNTDNAATTKQLQLSPDLTTEFHEYRLDWLPDRTDFYLDGVLQASFTDNVPTMAGKWLWNNWR